MMPIAMPEIVSAERIGRAMSWRNEARMFADSDRRGDRAFSER
jgi:hypothetical protein